MKKLLIAVVAIVVGVAVQAASVDWAFTETANNSSSPLDVSSYTAYLFTQSAWETFTALSETEQTAANFTGWTDSAAITKSAQGTSRTKFSTGTVTSTGNSGNYYIVLSNGEGFVASSMLAATSYTDPTMSHDAASWTISVAATPLSPASMTTFSVPEPTSGLLMLIGVAGLALRRRRA